MLTSWNVSVALTGRVYSGRMMGLSSVGGISFDEPSLGLSSFVWLFSTDRYVSNNWIWLLFLSFPILYQLPSASYSFAVCEALVPSTESAKKSVSILVSWVILCIIVAIIIGHAASLRYSSKICRELTRIYVDIMFRKRLVSFEGRAFMIPNNETVGVPCSFQT